MSLSLLELDGSVITRSWSKSRARSVAYRRLDQPFISVGTRVTRGEDGRLTRPRVVVQGCGHRIALGIAAIMRVTKTGCEVELWDGDARDGEDQIRHLMERYEADAPSALAGVGSRKIAAFAAGRGKREEGRMWAVWASAGGQLLQHVWHGRRTKARNGKARMHHPSLLPATKNIPQQFVEPGVESVPAWTTSGDTVRVSNGLVTQSGYSSLRKTTFVQVPRLGRRYGVACVASICHPSRSSCTGC